ncbi:hypothetical protein HK105_204230 [Polyrhizophydium stewartii]|uniref:DUF1746 domain-containing protein n=1 Tax=Polyrhizophydium stewartii TaxID=2732419 RepID=A0ABR4N9L7_9FUNG
MQSAVLTQTLLASLDHVIYVHFVYLYLLDFRITLQAPLAQSMSVRAGIRNIILVNAVFALFHLFKGADGPPVIIDFFADAHTTATSRLFLVFIDLAVMGMQLFRAMVLHTTTSPTRTSRLFFAISPPLPGSRRHSQSHGHPHHHHHNQHRAAGRASQSPPPPPPAEALFGSAAASRYHAAASGQLQSRHHADPMPGQRPRSFSFSGALPSSSSSLLLPSLTSASMSMAGTAGTETAPPHPPVFPPPQNMQPQPAQAARWTSSASSSGSGLPPRPPLAASGSASWTPSLESVADLEATGAPGPSSGVMPARGQTSRRGSMSRRVPARAPSPATPPPPPPPRDELSTVYTMEFDVPGVVRSIIYEQRSRQPVRSAGGGIGIGIGSPSGGGGSGGTARSSTSTLDVSGFRATLNWRILRLNAQLRAQRRRPPDGAGSPGSAASAVAGAGLGSAAERTTLLDASEADHGLAAAAGRDGRRHSDTDYERSSFTASEAGRDGDDAASDVSPEDAFYAHQGDIETGTAASGDPLLRRHAGQSGSRNLPV